MKMKSLTQKQIYMYVRAETETKKASLSFTVTSVAVKGGATNSATKLTS